MVLQLLALLKLYPRTVRKSLSRSLPGYPAADPELGGETQGFGRWCYSYLPYKLACLPHLTRGGDCCN